VILSVSAVNATRPYDSVRESLRPIAVATVADELLLSEVSRRTGVDQFEAASSAYKSQWFEPHRHCVQYSIGFSVVYQEYGTATCDDGTQKLLFLIISSERLRQRYIAERNGDRVIPLSMHLVILA